MHDICQQSHKEIGRISCRNNVADARLDRQWRVKNQPSALSARKKASLASVRFDMDLPFEFACSFVEDVSMRVR